MLDEKDNRIKLPSLDQIVKGLPAYPIELRLEKKSKDLLLGAAVVLGVSVVVAALLSNK